MSNANATDDGAKKLVPSDDIGLLAKGGHLTILEEIGQAANEAAKKGVFERYRVPLAENTITTHKNSIRRFETYLLALHPNATNGQMFAKPDAWKGVTWGIIVGFKHYELAQGSEIASINAHLSTVKKYCALAFQSEFISEKEHEKIREVRGIARQKARQNVNAKRDTTRQRKKTQNVLSNRQVRTIFDKIQDQQTEASVRDYLLACLLFRHGLRTSELMLINEASMNGGYLVFSRPKVGHEGVKHIMRRDTIQAFRAYREIAGDDFFWRSTLKGGYLANRQMSLSSFKRVVAKWGRWVGTAKLSPHDARHTLATKNAKEDGDVVKLKEFFGWTNLKTAQQYIEAAKISNRGIDTSY